jgi:molybdate transport system substrate-binding protein
VRPLKLLTTNSTRALLAQLLPRYEAETGQRVELVYDITRRMLERIAGGETGDLAVMREGAIADFCSAGILSADSLRPFARAVIGVGVRAGTPHPDISSVEALRATLLAARAIAHTRFGASGLHIPALLEKLGIAARMQGRIVNRDGGYIGEVVVAGEADIALQQIPELLEVPGLEVVGPIPDSLQKTLLTTGAAFTATPQVSAVSALLAYFGRPEHAPLFRAKGLQQVT